MIDAYDKKKEKIIETACNTISSTAKRSRGTYGSKVCNNLTDLEVQEILDRLTFISNGLADLRSSK